LVISADDAKLVEQAKAFVRDNRREIAKALTDPNIYLPEEHPVSVFMAGSPGAGKTEASLELLAQYGNRVLRIDPDDLRALIRATTEQMPPSSKALSLYS
jgi:hypothetical protein